MRFPACAFLAIVLLFAACHKEDKAAKLQALEKAYQSGVFTKEEYDAKRKALVGSEATSAPAVPSTNTTPAPAVPPPVVETPPAVPAETKAARAIAKTEQPPTTHAAPPPPPAKSVAPDEDPAPAPVAGCEDADARSGGPKGLQERFYPATVELVHRAASHAFENLDFAIHVDTADHMEASRRRHLGVVIGAGGERLILHFASARRGGQNGTRVTAETKKSIVGRLAQKSWTTAVLAQINCNLKSGR